MAQSITPVAGVWSGWHPRRRDRCQDEVILLQAWCWVLPAPCAHLPATERLWGWFLMSWIWNHCYLLCDGRVWWLIDSQGRLDWYSRGFLNVQSSALKMGFTWSTISIILFNDIEPSGRGVVRRQIPLCSAIQTWSKNFEIKLNDRSPSLVKSCKDVQNFWDAKLGSFYRDKYTLLFGGIERFN